MSIVTRITRLLGVAIFLCSAAAWAVQQLEIRSVNINFDTNQIYISGVNFDNGNDLEIRLSSFSDPLESVDITPTTIVASFPVAGLPAGNYLLMLTSGGGTVRHDEIAITVGAVGPEGPQGEQGPQGLQGVQGLPGEQGAQGDVGPMGPMGLPGPQGGQGSQGVKGDTGAQGPQGVAGPQGEQGPKGDSGADGLPGADGAEGPAGLRGIAGEPGADLTTELCALYSWAETVGGPLSPNICGSGSSGEACSADESGLSRCSGNAVEVCDGVQYAADMICSNLGGICQEQGPGLASCQSLTGCDPTNPAPTCGLGISCDLPTDPSQPAFCSGVAGTGAVGDACDLTTDCQAGSQCIFSQGGVVGSGTNVCSTTCVVGDGSNCPLFTQCVSFSTPQIAEGIEFGACASLPPP